MLNRSVSLLGRINFVISKSVSRYNVFNFVHVKGAEYKNFINSHLSQCFLKTVTQYPTNPAFYSYDQNVVMNYQEAYEKAVQLATSFVKVLHLKPKDRIGIYAYNRWQWYMVQMAAAIADLILVNINPAYQSQELAYTLTKVQCKVLVLGDKFKHMDYLKIVRSIIPEVETHSELDIQSKRFPHLKYIVRFNSGHQKVKGFVNFTDLFQDSNSSLFSFKGNPQDPANIQFTSGTTGLPKAATLSHFNILNNGYLIGQNCNYTTKDNILVPVPFYHCFGMIMGTLAALTRGAAITIVCQGFDPKKALLAATKYKATSIYGVPTMFMEYLRNYQHAPHQFDISTLRTGIVAGALCPEVLMNKMLTTLNLKEVTNCYGMTETSPVSFQTHPSDTLKRKTTTVGKILPGLQAKIMNDKNEICCAGEAGQFWVKGWAVMINYWGDKAATEKSIEDGWMKSGDMGVIDEHGYLSIVGRIKDMIIRGGENIYPKQIEEYLMKEEGVLDIQVVGVSDQKFGEEVAAVIKVKDLNNNALTKEKVFQFCKDKIAFYKIPKYVKFVTEMPLTVTGKPQKFILRKEFEEEKKKEGLQKYTVKQIK